MKLLLWLLTLFALAVGISLAAHNQGYVLLVLPPYRAEISLNLAVVLFVGGFVVLYALVRGIALMLSLPQRVRDFRERRLRDKTAVEITEITRLIYEGRFGLALKKAVAVHATAQSSALAAMLAARSALVIQALEEAGACASMLQDVEALLSSEIAAAPSLPMVSNQ